MPEGGTLTISAENLTVDAHYAGLHPEAKPGPYALVRVTDTGVGMSPEVATGHFGRLAFLAGMDAPASSVLTQQLHHNTLL